MLLQTKCPEMPDETTPAARSNQAAKSLVEDFHLIPDVVDCHPCKPGFAVLAAVFCFFCSSETNMQKFSWP